MFRSMRCCGSILGVILIVVAAAAVYSALIHPALISPIPAASSSAAATPATASAAANLDQRAAAFEQTVRQDAAAGKSVPVSISVSQAELTDRVNLALTSGEVKAPVTNVRVSIESGQVTTNGQASVGGLNAPLTIITTPQVANGQAIMAVTSVSLGPLPVPEALRNQISSAFDTRSLLGDLPLTVTSFRAVPGQLILEGTTKPG